MNDKPDIIAEWAQYASEFRRLEAYAIGSDGTRQPLDCAAVYVVLDDERGLIIALGERMEGEGVAICSLPQVDISAAQSDAGHAQADAQGNTASLPPTNQSVIAMRSGGANLIYLSPERFVDGRRR